MTILYALVARKKTVLAEYTSSSGNFPTVTRVLLGKSEFICLMMGNEWCHSSVAKLWILLL
jgi:hypothetical protein